MRSAVETHNSRGSSGELTLTGNEVSGAGQTG